MFKIIFGPTIGYARGLHPFLTSIITMAGMMTTVTIFSLLGERIRHTAFLRFFKFKKVFSKKSRRYVRIWKKYGIIGISFLTPILLSPPGGSILAIAFGGSKREIMIYMFIFSVIWSFILTYAYYYSGDSFRHLIAK